MKLLPLAVIPILGLSLGLPAVAIAQQATAKPPAAGAQSNLAPTPNPPNATLEATFTRTGQALVFDSIRDVYVLVRPGDSFQGMQVTSVKRAQLVLSSTTEPKHHFVLPLVQPARTLAAAIAPASVIRSSPSRPVVTPVRTAKEGPLDPYATTVLKPALAVSPPSRARSNLKTKAPTGPRSQPRPRLLVERIRLSRTEFDAALSDFTTLSKELQLTREGKRVRIKQIARGSFFHRLGLRSGDRVISVAGQPIHDLEAAAEVYALLKSTDRFTVKLLRGDQRTVLEVELIR